MAVALAQYVTNDASGTALSLALPGAPTAGNLLILVVGSTYTQTYNTPAGWTPLAAVAIAGSASGQAYTKISDGSEQTVTATFGSSTTNAGFYGECSGAGTFSGTSTAAAGATSCAYAPTVPTVAGSLVLDAISLNFSNGNPSTPTGFTACTHGSTFHAVYSFTLANPALGSNASQPSTFASNDYIAYAFLIAPAALGAVGNAGSATGAIGGGRNPGGAIGNG